MSAPVRRRVTLKDIAQKTGYSTITISKALRDKSDLADSTKTLIRDTAREMGYVGNGAASALRSGRTYMLAMTLVDVSNPYWGLFAKKAEEIARGYGYTFMIMNTDMDGLSEERAIRTAVERGVDGLLIDPSEHYQENVRILQKSKTPFVITGGVPEDAPVDAVWYDEYQSSYLATQALLAQGRRRLMMINLPDGLYSTEQRARGALAAMREAGLGEDSIDIRNVPNGIGKCLLAFQEALALHPDVDGVMTYSDHRAWEIASAIQKAGKRIPEDIAIVGCGDLAPAISIPFPIPTVSSHPVEQARLATELLIRRILGQLDGAPVHKNLPVHLVPREN